MRKHRGAEAPISLFSFQDIVTSICGIMILIVLLFLLQLREIEQRVESSVPEVSIAEDLTEELTEVRDELRQLREAAAREVHVSRATRIQSAVAATEEQIFSLQKRLSKEEKQNHDLSMKIEAKEAVLADLQQQIKNPKVIRKIQFIPEDSSYKTPVVAECSANRIRCGIIGSGKPTRDFNPGDLEAFVTFLKLFDRKNTYFVFMLKPSGATSGSTFVSCAKLLLFDVGYDALEEADTIDFGSRGGA